MPRIFDNVELELLTDADETGLRRLSAQLKAGKVRTADGNDALAWVDEQGHTVTKSQHDILRAAACKPTTTLRPRLTSHHAPMLEAVTGIILINGVPCVQIELKTLSVNPRRAMEQIVDYKNDPGNGYTKTHLCFLQLFIVSNQ